MADNSRIEDLRRRVQKDPASIAFAQLAEECRRAGQSQESVEICRVGLAIHPGYLSARVTLGRALIELNQLAEAQAELDHVLTSAPENLAALRGVAEIHHRLGNLPQALLHYRAALALARNDPDLQETVNDLSRKVEPPAPPSPADGLSLEQMTHELLLHHPPPLVPEPVALDAIAPPPVVSVDRAVGHEPDAQPATTLAPPATEGPATEEIVWLDAASDAAPPAGALDAEPGVFDIGDWTLPADGADPAAPGDHTVETADTAAAVTNDPIATRTTGALEAWFDAKPDIAPRPAAPDAEPVMVIPMLLAVPQAADHGSDAASAAAVDPLETEMVEWLDAESNVVPHAPHAAALDANLAVFDIGEWNLPEGPEPAADDRAADAKTAAALDPLATPTIGTLETWFDAKPDLAPRAAAPGAEPFVVVPWVPWVPGDPGLAVVPMPPAVLRAVDHEPGAQAATLDPLATRTIGALQEWLDAIHVARTHRGA